MSHPVSFDLERPVSFDRAHVFLRVALLIVIGWIAHPTGLLRLGLPVVAGILISHSGGQRYPPFTLETGPLSPVAPTS